MNGILKHLFAENPMTLEKTRGWRKFFQVGQEGATVVNRVILGLLGLIYCWILFVIFYYHEDMSLGLTILEMAFLTLVVPGALYGAISGEREKLTWDALIMTRLTPGQILGGKFFARLPMILTIMGLFFVPILLCHFVENSRNQVEFTIGQLLTAQFLVLGWSVFLAGFALMISAKTKRSITTLAIVVVSLLSFLGLIPSLTQLFDNTSQNGRYTPAAGTDFMFVPQPESMMPLRMVGKLLTEANPFVALTKSADKSNIGASYRESTIVPGMSLMGIWASLYLLLGGLSLRSALGTLRGLELPNQRPEPKRVRPLDPDAAPDHG